MSRTVSWLLVLLCFGLFAGATAWALRARSSAGRDLPDYSVYSEERDGLAPAARFLSELGWQPVAVTRPLLETSRRGLLVVAGSEEEWSENEANGVLHWVEQGNTLLLCGRRSTGLHQALDVGISPDDHLYRGQSLPRLDAVPGQTPYTAGVDRLEVEGQDNVRADTGVPLWYVGDDVGAAVLHRGKGRVLIVADPSVLTLRGLRRKDNAVFLYNVAEQDAREGRIYFDEYHHGLQSGGGFWDYLRYHGQGWVVLPVLAVVVLGIWSMAVRLGPAVSRVEPAGADAVDYASAVARIYQRAGTHRLLARSTVRRFLTALTRHLRLRRGALPAEVLAAWRQRHGDQLAARLESVLRGTTELRRGTVSERRLLEWTRTFDQFEAEVTRAG